MMENKEIGLLWFQHLPQKSGFYFYKEIIRAANRVGKLNYGVGKWENGGFTLGCSWFKPDKDKYIFAGPIPEPKGKDN